jgi:hypothetical protein
MTMPQMSAAFVGWKSTLEMKVVSQNVVNGFVQETERPLTILATWQPLSSEEIELKPVGQRSWSWYWLHYEGATLLFATNDRVVYKGVKYKVMAVKDYTLNNFSEYHLVLDYQAEASE